MKRSAILVSLIILVSILISSCGGASVFGGPTQTPDPCRPDEMKRYADAIEGVNRRFDDAYDLANNTGRGSLSPVIGDLQEIRRDAEDLEVPACAGEARDRLIIYMDVIIEGFLLFLSNSPDEEVGAKFDMASAYFRIYLNSLAEMTEGE